jgi:hypothetical protein
MAAGQSCFHGLFLSYTLFCLAVRLCDFGELSWKAWISAQRAVNGLQIWLAILMLHTLRLAKISYILWYLQAS